jgi:hypothetical protein
VAGEADAAAGRLRRPTRINECVSLAHCCWHSRAVWLGVKIHMESRSARPILFFPPTLGIREWPEEHSYSTWFELMSGRGEAFFTASDNLSSGKRRGGAAI